MTGRSTTRMPGEARSLGRVAAYRYVDFAARRRPGFRNCLIAVERVPGFVRRYGAWGCYATFYLFDESLLRYAEEHSRAGRPSVAGYVGPVLAPVWPLDIDAPDLREALQAARSIHEHLLGSWQIPRGAVRIYFSGKKGFHLTIDTRVFGAHKPSWNAPEALYDLTWRLVRELGFSTAGPLDLALRDRVRLLRLPNTRHEGSGLFKVPLTEEEFLGLDATGIQGLARGPRPMKGVDATGLLVKEPTPVSQGARVVFEECAARPNTRHFPTAVANRPRPGVLDCPARKYLLETPAPIGQRNNTAIRLASWLREGGVSRDEVEATLQAWNASAPDPLDEVEVRHVVISAFAPPNPYLYGCRDPLLSPHCPVEPGKRTACPYHAAHATAHMP